MKILINGGGPAGLFGALLLKKRCPGWEIHLTERHAAQDTFGWGVVLSEDALEAIGVQDADLAAALAPSLHHWDTIEIRRNTEVVRSSGHDFYAISRYQLLQQLQDLCESAGVIFHWQRAVTDPVQMAISMQADLLIGADGLYSAVRQQLQSTFQPRQTQGKTRFVWLGTSLPLDSFLFSFVETEHGWIQAHAYRHHKNSDGVCATWIVEMPEAVWEQGGWASMQTEESLNRLETLFARDLQGHSLYAQHQQQRGSVQWMQFPQLFCQRWQTKVQADGRQLSVVLAGDAAHTAHFSIGSGTRLAMDDMAELVSQLCASDPRNLSSALQQYEQIRQTGFLRYQSAARNSMNWFEHAGRYQRLPMWQMAYSLLTRSQRILHDNLALRDPALVTTVEQQIASQSGIECSGVSRISPAMTPFRLRELHLKNRIVVSPMAQYQAKDGIAGDYHLMHYLSRAMGGAGLVMTEMTAVSADARITPACTGLYNDEQLVAWRRITDAVHRHSDARIGIQLGHAGAKGACHVPWEGEDLPLGEDGWPLIAASETVWRKGVSVKAEQITLSQMQLVKQAFVEAAHRAACAGFDWLELHCAHGYLLSGFLSPLTNNRVDAYGGSTEARCRYPLEVFAAVRAVWPAHLPVSVRISAHDWLEGGMTPEMATEIALRFREAGADLIDCSSGQVHCDQQPVYGRMYQTPFADQIRQEAGIATMAVGAITSLDQVNTIIAAGRADLCAIGRPHLMNPNWTLHQLAQAGIAGQWPLSWQAGERQLRQQLQTSKENP
ncbi:oxidoreductase [Undibacterium squillarum]|uniref:Bifunctional hydroxylase/oxidoreductase n=1 Tax=Undibacterium squillarum TaxID=1131567 RepID=A0ABQ2XQS5_9BURK|nr:FAD-dependent monooxygenase [Undibacterium squillarum]GGX29595.1 bifunctional hydroxylase/oxidoreductase [Undibacterium squillarum]